MGMVDQARVRDVLEAFCGADEGRSAALSGGAVGDVTIAVRGDVARPAASVIKVATVMALFDLAGRGLADLDEAVPVGALGATRYCSILKAFDPARTLSLREVAALSLITSDNPATVHVMSRLRYDDIAGVLAESGCSDAATCAAGFSEAELGAPNRANRLTAYDAVQMFRHLRSVPRYAPIVVFLENNLRNARIPALLPDDAIVAHKTGSLDGVVNDAGIVSRAGRSFIVAFLCDGQADPIATQNEMAAASLELFDLLISS
jgi:beta-lactamase class A